MASQESNPRRNLYFEVYFLKPYTNNWLCKRSLGVSLPEVDGIDRRELPTMSLWDPTEGVETLRRVTKGCKSLKSVFNQCILPYPLYGRLPQVRKWTVS